MRQNRGKMGCATRRSHLIGSPRRRRAAARHDRRARLGRAVGRGIVVAMPIFMHVLSIVGTAAMTWVGGSIIAHGLYEFGITGPEYIIEAATHWAESTFTGFAGVAGA